MSYWHLFWPHCHYRHRQMCHQPQSAPCRPPQNSHSYHSCKTFRHHSQSPHYPWRDSSHPQTGSGHPNFRHSHRSSGMTRRVYKAKRFKENFANITNIEQKCCKNSFSLEILKKKFHNLTILCFHSHEEKVHWGICSQLSGTSYLPALIPRFVFYTLHGWNCDSCLFKAELSLT